MMQKIAVSMRSDTNQSYAEVRDGIDQRWISFLLACDLHPIIIPNNIPLIKLMCAEDKFDGILLTGGNDVTGELPQDKNRDQCETLLLQHAIGNELPVLGVCRGMQFIAHHFGAGLLPCEGHVTQSISIQHQSESRLSKTLKNISAVNSYHNFQLTNIPTVFRVLAISDDNVIKSIEHTSAQILAIMWHPERDVPFNKNNIHLFQQLFQRKNTLA